MALQNLVTVVSLVLAAMATSVMLRRATEEGSSSTTLATRCSARARPGSNERMRTRGLASDPAGLDESTGSDRVVDSGDSEGSDTVAVSFVGCSTSSSSVGKLLTPGICDKVRSEEHTSELQSRETLVCRLLLAK